MITAGGGGRPMKPSRNSTTSSVMSFCVTCSLTDQSISFGQSSGEQLMADPVLLQNMPCTPRQAMAYYYQGRGVGGQWSVTID